MDAVEIAFKAVAVLHTIVGYVLVGAALDEEFQQECFYANSNPLAGDIKKYLVITGSGAMAACGILAFKIPVVAVALAWISLACWFVTGFVDIPWTRRPPGFCKACAINFLVRCSLAGLLTLLYHRLDG